VKVIPFFCVVEKKNLIDHSTSFFVQDTLISKPVTFSTDEFFKGKFKGNLFVKKVHNSFPFAIKKFDEMGIT
jgi:hypothetical protein